VKDKLDQNFVSFLSNKFDERFGGEGLAKFVGGETVLGERIIEVVEGWISSGRMCINR
jgi:hypothetical protein